MARAIDMMRMKRPGSAAPVLQLFASEYLSESLSPANATASFTLSTGGLATGADGGAYDSYDWLTFGTASLYEVIVVLLSGTFSTGAAGTFPMNTTRTWSVSKSTLGIKSALATFSIRRISDAVVMVPATSIKLQVLVE